jgi:hypothetical protein
MKFAQRSAGNAHRSCPSRTGVTPRSMTFSARSPRALLLLVAVLVAAIFPTAAFAGGSPILSGYAGPGSGEQAVLGGVVVGGGGSGSGGSGSGGGDKSLAVTNTSAAAPSSGSTGAAGRSSSGSGDTLAPAPHRKKSSSTSSSSTSTKSTGSSTSTSSQASSASASVTARPGAPAVVAYRDTSGEVGSFPLTAGGVLLAAFGLIAIVLAVLGLRMLMGPHREDPPPISQVAVR